MDYFYGRLVRATFMKLPENKHITKCFSTREIAEKMNDGEYSAEMLLQHLAVHWNRVEAWGELSDSYLRLRCGELTAQEIRTVRAVLNAILANTPVIHGSAANNSKP